MRDQYHQFLMWTFLGGFEGFEGLGVLGVLVCWGLGVRGIRFLCLGLQGFGGSRLQGFRFLSRSVLSFHDRVGGRPRP